MDEIFKKAKTEIALPLVRRLASQIAAVSATVGLTQEQIGSLEAILVMIGGLLLDLTLSHLQGKR